MTLYEAVAHAFGVMPTGGFSTQPDSVASFSAASQWIMGAFMLLAGMNYLILYRALVRRQPGRVVRDEELRLYVALVVVASAALTRAALGLRDRRGRGGRPPRLLPGRLDRDDDGRGERGLRASGRRSRS